MMPQHVEAPLVAAIMMTKIYLTEQLQGDKRADLHEDGGRKAISGAEGLIICVSATAL